MAPAKPVQYCPPRRQVADAPAQQRMDAAGSRLDRGHARMEPTEEEVRHAPENPGPHRPATRPLEAFIFTPAPRAPALGRRRISASRNLRPDTLPADRDGSLTAPCERGCRPRL